MAEIDLIPASKLLRPHREPPTLFARRDLGKLTRTLVKKTGQAIADYDLIAAGDRIMVCLSGGKDSYALLDVLRLLQRRAPVEFELLAVNIDQGWPGYDSGAIVEFLEREQVAHEMVREDFKPVVEQHLHPGATPCSLCSRLRRGVLYNLAERLGCTKIALGHHMDDAIETLVMNMFFSGRLASMPPRLLSDDGRNTVIRPMIYVAEQLLVDYARQREFPIVGCACPSCGLPEQKRQVVKRLLAGLEAENPGLKTHMLAALRNVNPSHLLDPRLWARLGSTSQESG